MPQDKQNEGILIRFICQNLGFLNGGPIAACIVYRWLLHWKSFGAVHTNVFSGIITSMRSRIKVNIYGNVVHVLPTKTCGFTAMWFMLDQLILALLYMCMEEMVSDLASRHIVPSNCNPHVFT